MRRTSEIRELSPQSLPPRSTPDRALHPLDENLLERLETRFFRDAGDDGRIDSKELAATLVRVDFYWLNRDQYSFEWFTELLGKLARLDERGLVRVYFCGPDGLGKELYRACAARGLRFRQERF